MSGEYPFPFAIDLCEEGWTLSRIPGHPAELDCPESMAIVPNSDAVATKQFKLADLDQGAMFLNFAELEPTAENFVGFANRFGGLGRPVTNQSGEPLYAPWLHGSDFLDWQNCHRNVKRFVEMWSSRPKRSKRDFAKWCDSPPQDQLLSSITSAFSRAGVGVYSFYSPADGLQHAFNGGLDAAIAAQMLEAFRLGKEFRRCPYPYCQRYFESRPVDNRSGKVYCSQNCSFKAWRRRKSQEAKK